MQVHIHYENVPDANCVANKGILLPIKHIELPGLGGQWKDVVSIMEIDLT